MGTKKKRKEKGQKETQISVLEKQEDGKVKRKLLGRKRVKILKFNPSQQLFSSICRAELYT